LGRTMPPLLIHNRDVDTFAQSLPRRGQFPRIHLCTPTSRGSMATVAASKMSLVMSHAAA
jgi:hypothetical protein